MKLIFLDVSSEKVKMLFKTRFARVEVLTVEGISHGHALRKLVTYMAHFLT